MLVLDVVEAEKRVVVEREVVLVVVAVVVVVVEVWVGPISC